MKKLLKFIFNLFLLFFVLITIFFAYLSIFQQALLLEYISKIQDLVHYLWYWNFLIILIFAFLESFPLIWTSIPWQTVLITIAGFLWFEYAILSIILSSLWALLWNYSAYLLGVYYWDWFFKKYGNWFWIWQTDIKYIKKWIEKNWRLFVIFWKFHNLFRAFVPFIAGTSSMKSKSFTLANIVWSCLRSVVMVVLGVFFVQNAELILSNIWKIIIFLVIWFALYVFFFKKKELALYIKEKNKELDDMFTK